MAATSYQGDPTAVMGRRILAYLIDTIIGLALFAAIFVPMALGKADKTERTNDTVAHQVCREINRNTFDVDENGNVDDGSGFGSTGSDDDVQVSLSGNDPICVNVGSTTWIFTPNDVNSLKGSAYLFGTLATVLNLVVLQSLVGASVGKLIVGLRVVRADGNRAGIGWMFLRWLLLIVDGFCCALVGLITAFSSKGHRRVGDMAAGTFVVRRDAVGRPLNIPGVTGGYGAPGYPQGAPGGYPGGYPGGQGWTPPPTGSTGGWDQPAATGSWTPPAAPGSDPTAVAPAATASGTEPTWDAARNAYIQYDQAQAAWVQWDDASSTWKPISQ